MTNRVLARRILQKMGYEAALAEDGEEALGRCAEADYELVLMDLQMPRLDGVEATRRIRSLPGRAARPYIVALTASTQPEELRQCREAGMNDYLSKPLQIAALRAALLRGHAATRPRP